MKRREFVGAMVAGSALSGAEDASASQGASQTGSRMSPRGTWSSNASRRTSRTPAKCSP